MTRSLAGSTPLPLIRTCTAPLERTPGIVQPRKGRNFSRAPVARMIRSVVRVRTFFSFSSISTSRPG
jgi:hypothetical protein